MQHKSIHNYAILILNRSQSSISDSDMDSFPLDDFAIYVELAQSEDASEMSNASEAVNVKNEDISSIKSPGELI